VKADPFDQCAEVQHPPAGVGRPALVLNPAQKEGRRGSLFNSRSWYVSNPSRLDAPLAGNLAMPPRIALSSKRERILRNDPFSDIVGELGRDLGYMRALEGGSFKLNSEGPAGAGLADNSPDKIIPRPLFFCGATFVRREKCEFSHRHIDA